jgi:deazaflavin-dependent oxidoreductase (nitroreductase family)
MSQPNKSNRFVAFMLRSPLCVFMSGLLLITVTGRKTGRLISTPVNYVRDGDTLLVTSKVDRIWWKNLRGGAPITLRLNGKTYRAAATVIEDRAAVEQKLLRFFRLTKRTIAGVHLTPEGQPTKPEKFARVAQTRVIIEITQLAAP